MKKIIPILIVALVPFFSKGQAYLPMNLDQTSYWVMDYSWGGIAPVQGERICQVIGDTMVNGNLYHKVFCYTAKGRNNTSSYGIGLHNDRTYFVHEDTIQKKLYMFNNFNQKTREVNFGLNVGDTSNMFMYETLSAASHPLVLIDSVKNENYYGNVQRRTQYANYQFSNTFSTIEGVGASHSFPEGNWGEWGIPLMTCKCYSKNSTIQYLDGIPADSCYKKPRQPLRPTNLGKLNKLDVEFNFWNNEINLSKQDEGPLHLKLFSINGGMVYSKVIHSKNYKKSFRNLPNGLYILSLYSNEGVENRKILIR